MTFLAAKLSLCTIFLFGACSQMCEQAAEAHKSKGVAPSPRRFKASPDASQFRRSSIDAILDNTSSTLSTQVRYLYFQVLLNSTYAQASYDMTDVSFHADPGNPF